MTISVLVIEDDATVRETLVEYFETCGYTARGAPTATIGRALAREHAPDVVVLDLRLPDASGVATLEALKADDPDVGILLLTGYADVQTAVQAMQGGASDVLEKPVDLETLRLAVERAAERGRMHRELLLLREASGGSDRRVGPMNAFPLLGLETRSMIELAMRNTDATVLLQGETGTGKGFVARAIHDGSLANRLPFVEVNCATLSPTLVESELFGHERGAFTDARSAKRGLFEVAGGGSVFLDEIAETPLDVQPKLLKVIEEREFRRVGGTTTLRSGARILAATNQPLSEAVACHRFRADLFYRLGVLTITLPPLRESPRQIVPLARTMLLKGASLSENGAQALRGYHWPGNLRELKNTLWRAALLADGSPIEERHLGLMPPVTAAQSAGAALDPVGPGPTEGSGTPSLRAIERDVIVGALASNGGNRSRTAKELGIARSTLLEKIKRFGIA